MTYKCKICGGQTTVDTVNGIATCEYCGVKQALPLFTDDSERLLYESGNAYLSHSEYDKAENVFNQLLTIKPSAAELYWDLVLCKYGVTYVKDPKTEKYIPTCNRTHYTPIFSDENYKKAIELSAGEKKSLFEEDAKTIDNIQKGIIAVSKKEKPFDIFISYKETDSKGNRTKDSVEAQKLYEKLTEAGYKVFFSRITLEDKVGTEYEPYIYAALYSSKVMITVCSSNENIEAVWVKNEWSRFLSLQQKNADKTIIPLYFDMEKQELPDEFAMIPSFNIKETGFEAELLRGIKKQIPLPIMLAQKRKARNKTLLISALSFLGVLVVCGVILLPGFIRGSKYDEAMKLFKNQQYAEAKAIFSSIENYEDAKYMAERCEVQSKYDDAMQLYYNGEYAKSTWAFEALGDYEDAKSQKEKAELSWRKSLATMFSTDWGTGDWYINENGTLTIENRSDAAYNDIKVTKNGKAISTISHGFCYFYSQSLDDMLVLYENGTVIDPDLKPISNELNWNNIIKVIDINSMGFFGLTADGKIVSIHLDDKEFNNCLDSTSTWENIIDFQSTNYASYSYAAIVVGLKADGTLCSTRMAIENDFFYVLEEEEFATVFEFLNASPFEFEKALEKFKNVKTFKVCGRNILALTHDNKLLTYIDGEFNELDATGIVDVVTDDIVLKSNGDLTELVSGNVLLHNVAHADYKEGYAVTKNGNIYRIVDGIKKTSYVTTVYEEWTKRLD